MIVEARTARGARVLLDAGTPIRGAAVVGDVEIDALAMLPARTQDRWIAARLAAWRARGDVR